MLFLLHRYAPKVPGALVAVVVGIGAAVILPLAEMGVKLTGTVPSGLPSFVLPSLSFILQNLAVILPAAVGVMLVVFPNRWQPPANMPVNIIMMSISIRKCWPRAWPTPAPDYSRGSMWMAAYRKAPE